MLCVDGDLVALPTLPLLTFSGLHRDGHLHTARYHTLPTTGKVATIGVSRGVREFVRVRSCNVVE